MVYVAAQGHEDSSQRQHVLSCRLQQHSDMHDVHQCVRGVGSMQGQHMLARVQSNFIGMHDTHFCMCTMAYRAISMNACQAALQAYMQV